MPNILAQITITLDGEGKININVIGAQSDNKVTVLGLLEMAKAAIASNGNQPAPPATPPLLVARGALPPNGVR